VATATLTWNFPTTRTDGSLIAATDTLSGTLFDSVNPTMAIATVMGTPGSHATFTTPELSAGIHDFTEVTMDSEGNASAASNVAGVTVALAKPSAVTNLTAVLNP
jgi:hypothetical protein